MVIVIVVIALVVLAGLIFVLIRNSIIAARNRVDESWSGIDVQLKRRHDLVPNLVETVKGYADARERGLRENDQGPGRGDEGQAASRRPPKPRAS